MSDATNDPAFLRMTNIYQRQREFFLSGQTASLAFRVAHCKALKQAVIEYEPQILAALYQDMRRPGAEAYVSEVALIIKEIDHTVKHLKAWMRPQRVKTSWMLQPGKSDIHPEPYGNTLIIGPWNYPFQLLLSPLIGAIAAGNTAVLKVSEIAVHSAKVIDEMISRYFPPHYIAVVQGGPEITQTLLDQPFDYLFFTGSVAVGRVILERVAPRLTPVTLELGGKSPCIVTAQTDLKTAAKRICWGKFFNAGQTCVAPDYLLVEQSVRDKLLIALKETITQFYGREVQQSADYGRIINLPHFHRLQRLMANQTLYVGGDSDVAELYIAPTLLVDVSPQSLIMQEEIFGPLLPVLTYQSLDEAIHFVRSRAKPLALYLFSECPKTQQRILQETSSGSVNINETLSQLSSTTLPFGGVGESGMGSYHGEATFRTFSHYKSVLHRSIRFDNSRKYAPYRIPLHYLKKLLRLIG
ncbi:MAG: aldehyde dehydrogenase [Gammaproteobacteria bacterium]|nr:aldehyde dehydrogenase [Gammaproteobacteria bacterium]